MCPRVNDSVEAYIDDEVESRAIALRVRRDEPFSARHHAACHSWLSLNTVSISFPWFYVCDVAFLSGEWCVVVEREVKRVVDGVVLELAGYDKKRQNTRQQRRVVDNTRLWSTKHTSYNTVYVFRKNPGHIAKQYYVETEPDCFVVGCINSIPTGNASCVIPTLPHSPPLRAAVTQWLNYSPSSSSGSSYCSSSLLEQVFSIAHMLQDYNSKTICQKLNKVLNYRMQ